MKIRFFTFLGLIALFTSCSNDTKSKVSYKDYHQAIITAEEYIGNENYEDALKQYEKIFTTYDFCFLRDYQIASQLLLITNKKEKGLTYIKKGIANGWELENIKSQKVIQQHLTDADWRNIEKQYDDLRSVYLNRIDTIVMNKVKLMIEKDQKMALKAYLIEDEEKQEAYILKNFPKHSEVQLKDLFKIIHTKGYPGEFLIGNNFWGSTILSHHNSIEPNYVRNDTLYPYIRPKLFQALDEGYISPYEIALIEDWKEVIITDEGESLYGYLNPPNTANISQINKTRKAIGLRSVELRNKLIDISHKTGINFYLPDWVEGKITIEKE
ncbi:hypothetical protein [Aquimarina litoralis]|uniref:hypothetical protein n=1 Tax=Aquimarina litoralis TaxID=584605 RepID=UPI001C57872D|nr:hypothetical protein [Aquimarina litoralis]MBW1294753.1 hypothetical protein [Aquimarina litoralis]